MTFSSNRNLIRWIIIFSSFIIVSLILWNTYSFFQKFKAEERVKIKTWSVAQNNFLRSIDDLTADVDPVTTHVLTETTTSTPMLIIDKKGDVNNHINLNEEKLKDTTYINYLINKFSSENEPIEVVYKGEVFQTIYYGNSPLLKKIGYYPLALLLIILLFHRRLLL